MSNVPAHGCQHYKRRCKIFAPCCQEFFWCRHCHNLKKDSEEEDQHKRHVLDRHSIRELLCTLCNTRQPVSEVCRSCGINFGQYSCLLCNMFDDDTDKGQFHCDGCGICRVGGRHNFFHCDTCGCCYSTNLQGGHRCVEGNLDNPCAVCSEYLFDSVRQISVLNCGHTVHKDCLKFLDDARFSGCPLCRRTNQDEAATQKVVEHAIGVMTDGATLDTSVSVYCRACLNVSTAHQHVLGQQCNRCGSFNTQPPRKRLCDNAR